MTYHIISADDDDLIRESLEDILVAKGFTVSTAANKEELFEIIEEKFPDLILLDVDFGGISGFKVCQELKNRPKMDMVPIIFITGFTNIDYRVRAFEVGGADYITKPFEPLEVLIRVQNHLKLSQIAKDAAKVNREMSLQISKGIAKMFTKSDKYPEAKFEVYYKHILPGGGDFYDVIKIDEDKFMYMVADVAGHDISVSYTTAVLKGLLKAQMHNKKIDLLPAIELINAVLQEIYERKTYLTATLLVLDRKEMVADIFNAAHPPMLLCQKGGKSLSIEGKGDVIGMFDTCQWDQKKIKVQAGDRFFLYTDGLIPDFKKYSEEIEYLLRICTTTNMLNIAESVEEIISQLIKNGDIADDILLMGIEV